jgi:hypothetical protein
LSFDFIKRPPYRGLFLSFLFYPEINMTTSSHALLETLAYARDYMVKLIDGLSVEQLNTIPEGFRNNLIWNLTHVIAVQQAVFYQRSNVTPHVPETIITNYNNGTFPEAQVSAEQIAQVKAWAVDTAEQFRKDYEAGAFSGFQAFTISARNIPLNNIDDALGFILYHEGMHVGYMQALKRLVA